MGFTKIGGMPSSLNRWVLLNAEGKYATYEYRNHATGEKTLTFDRDISFAMLFDRFSEAEEYFYTYENDVYRIDLLRFTHTETVEGVEERE